MPKVKSTIGQCTFKLTGAKDWNELPNELWADGLSLGSLKRKTFKYLQEQDVIHSINIDCRLIRLFFCFFFIVYISLSACLLYTHVLNF